MIMATREVLRELIMPEKKEPITALIRLALNDLTADYKLISVWKG